MSNFNNAVLLTSDITRTDDIMTVPTGVGFAYGYDAFIVDVQAFSPIYFNNILVGGNQQRHAQQLAGRGRPDRVRVLERRRTIRRT